eukprot:jgi/Mesvir1/9865/Mv22403-RA.1
MRPASSAYLSTVEGAGVSHARGFATLFRWHGLHEAGGKIPRDDLSRPRPAYDSPLTPVAFLRSSLSPLQSMGGCASGKHTIESADSKDQLTSAIATGVTVGAAPVAESVKAEVAAAVAEDAGAIVKEVVRSVDSEAGPSLDAGQTQEISRGLEPQPESDSAAQPAIMASVPSSDGSVLVSTKEDAPIGSSTLAQLPLSRHIESLKRDVRSSGEYGIPLNERKPPHCLMHREESVYEFSISGATVVVFGASGDLAKKKTFPALIALHCHDRLPRCTKIFGYARTQMTTAELHARIRPYLLKTNTEDQVDSFLSIVSYVQGGYDDPDGYGELQRFMSEFEAEVRMKPVQRLYYLALPPPAYPDVCKHIALFVENDGATRNGGWTRMVVEKPFGHDTKSAEVLSAQILQYWDEDQLYRIDHYLGKEIVQNMVMIRFGNRFLHAVFNNQHIANVQITFKEDIGTEGRAGYFDSFGIIRDIMQNHLLQVLSLLAMETPISMSSNDVRDEKTKVLRCVEDIKLEDVVLGQYVKNPDIPPGKDGHLGYLEEEGVPKDSKTPTFAVVVMHINNDRWDGVPFILKAAKGVEERVALVRVQFKEISGSLFANKHGQRNELVMRLQPAEAIYMKTVIKEPGYSNNVILGELDLTYHGRFKSAIPQAYERLLLDVFNGDQQHFVRTDELMTAWKIFTPLLEKIEAGGVPLHPYVFGSRGPEEADDLVAKAGYIRSTAYKWEEGEQVNTGNGVSKM